MKRYVKASNHWREKTECKTKNGKIVHMQNVSNSFNDQDYYVLYDAEGNFVEKSLDFNYLHDKLYGINASISVKADSDLRYMDFKGRVPKKIKDATLEYMDTDGVSLADAFEWACREYAPEGSELWKAWYYNDFRKFIPSAYDPQYLDFKKYPLKYTIQGSSSDASTRSSITASMDDEDNELDLYDMIDYIDANWDKLGCGEKMSRKEAEYYLGHSVSDMSKEEVDQEVSELQKAYYVDGEASDEEIVDMYNCMIAAK